MIEITRQAILDALARAEAHQPDYGQIMCCKSCGWSGPFYLMFMPTKYPGMPRCAECKSDNTAAEAPQN